MSELKPTLTTLQLVDGFVRVPRGIIEDVLVQVDRFYYPVDFIILDTEPISNTSTQIPVILGRPFLATSNVIINCKNGVMSMSFGNMTLEMNIFFNTGKRLEEDDDVHDINMIDTFVEDRTPLTLSSDPLETCLAHSHEFDDDTIRETCAMLDAAPVLEVNRWRPQFEELPQTDAVPLSSNL
ncbi:retropepsin-like aspartic protease, partial [Mycobacterium kansasii]